MRAKRSTSFKRGSAFSAVTLLMLLASCAQEGPSARGQESLDIPPNADGWAELMDQRASWLASQFQKGADPAQCAADILSQSKSSDPRQSLAAFLTWPAVTIAGNVEPRDSVRLESDADRFKKYIKEFSDAFCRVQAEAFAKDADYFDRCFRVTMWSGTLFKLRDSEVGFQNALEAMWTVSDRSRPFSWWQLRNLHYLAHFWGRDDLREGLTEANFRQRADELVRWLDRREEGRIAIVVVDQRRMGYRITKGATTDYIPAVEVNSDPLGMKTELRTGVVRELQQVYDPIRLTERQEP